MGFINIAAIDLGASSGRVMLASYSPERQTLTLEEIHRFKNRLVRKNNHDCWDLLSLENEITLGLHNIINSGKHLDSIGIDTWGVDYVLLDKQGNPVAPPYAYRDSRTNGVMERVQAEIGKAKIYQKTGIQFLTFNTLYQLKAMVAENPSWLTQVHDFVMIPDYLNFRLTGVLNQEYTNATTTQLINVETDNWDKELLNYLGLPESWFGQIRHPGIQIGYWHNNTAVISVASHDTASAVIATPLTDPWSAYLCSGTWSLMGVDSTKVYTDSIAMNANISNEGGIDGHYRVLKNIMGLWLFQRVCAERKIDNIQRIIDEAEKLPAFRSLINPNAACFLNPPSMTAAIQQYCATHEQTVPRSDAEIVRCIFDSLALLYKKVGKQLAALQQQAIPYLHIVGGGCQNQFLNQLCADVCGMTVIAGPIEASVLGNVGCQLMALDQIKNVNDYRNLIRKNFPLKSFSPQKNFKASRFFAEKWQLFNQLN